MSDIVFARESFEGILEELKPIFSQHWEEIAMYQDVVEYAPDWDKYFALERSDILHLLTARDDGKLVGYFMALVIPGMHYKHTTYAMNDILFLHPDYRKTGLSIDLFKYAEAYFVGLGVDVMSIHMKVYAPFDNLCLGLGYDCAERLYTKYVGGNRGV